MRYIQELREGDNVSGIWLVRRKNSLLTKAGKAYESLSLQDKTGTLDAKIWDPGSMGIEEFDELDYVEVSGNVTAFQGHLQLNVRRARRCREGEYDPRDYLPSAPRPADEMWNHLMHHVDSVEEPHLHMLLERFFKEDEQFIRLFRSSSAAKAVHHGFMGGLLQHTLGVADLCNFYAKAYPFLNRDLLMTAALLHDVGKVRELSLFPQNDYTDAGQLVGHIVIGVEMIGEKVSPEDDFPPVLLTELKHCILAHHGEFEYGSPKKPAIAEAAALNFADNTDAKLEIFRELLSGAAPEGPWLGYQGFLESNIRRTQV